ncbi:hypothetical protein CANCADRAFT_27600 [Tortispora caseinolytica NRRL Y-17796]|uniref:Amino acid permease/ SLC12A domain-containing protein n=1 Tax=Tortispora caseinolytica NRRL Y-17796 TaxID=767744 RepID=A0A1E4TDH0_9ASCO|nr:hypothetical protein CANCADRAFT_27600 [Tortispora caseinolytica NRRL Y-17796]
METDPLVARDDASSKHHQPRNLGVLSASSLIFNKMIGTGVFSTPSLIYASTGSLGISLILWILGGIFSLTGISVYLEFGLAIPKSGGEYHYLQRVYRKPQFLISCIFLTQMILVGFSSGNCLAFGQYLLFALGSQEPSDWNSRLIALAVLTLVCLLHAFKPAWGTRLGDILGVVKIGVLVLIIAGGIAALRMKDLPGLQNFEHFFANDGFGGSLYDYSVALLNIIYSYKGWENANYVLSEVHNPSRTLSIAGPLAVGATTILYVAVNLAYFAAIPKADIASSGVIVAGLFFRNVFGLTFGQRILPMLILLSNLGNILAVSFAQARVNQELGREGLLPYSDFWASTTNGSPAAGLLLHWIVSAIVLIAPPPGPAYQFIIDLYAYPGAWINVLVGAGLIYLHLHSVVEQWGAQYTDSVHFHSHDIINFVFLASNLFVVIVPFIPPPSSTVLAPGYPYYLVPLVGSLTLLLGVPYWFWLKSRIVHP